MSLSNTLIELFNKDDNIYNDIGDPTKYLTYDILHITPDKWTKVINIITKQNYTVLHFYCQDINIITKQKNIYENFNDFDSLECSNIIATDDSISIQLPHFEELYTIISNSTNRYIYIQIACDNREESSCHQTLLVIDKYRFGVYLVDPNGLSVYLDNEIDQLMIQFNTITKKENNFVNKYSIVEELLTEYIKDFNNFCSNKPDFIDYEYVKQTSWLKKHKGINVKLQSDNEDIRKGNCVILTVCMIYLSHTTNKDIDDIYSNLQKLNHDEILYLISIFYNYLSLIMSS